MHAISFLLLVALVYCTEGSEHNSQTADPTPQKNQLCVLPPRPDNGDYALLNGNSHAPGDAMEEVYMTYSCDQGHRLDGSKIVYCVHGLWFSEPPECKEMNSCVESGQQGVCRPSSECQASARRSMAEVCLPRGTICCLDNLTLVATAAPSEAQTTAEPLPEDYDSSDTETNACEPIPSNWTSAKTGKKAWDKCIEYQSKYVYVCEENTAGVLGDKIRQNNCGHASSYDFGENVNVGTGEFPQMVLLGYGEDPKTAQWLCMGTIISEKFVLTAAHCTRLGTVKYVRTAVIKKSDVLEWNRVYNVTRVIVHPSYFEHNDIALAETDHEMLLDRFAMPACLPSDRSNDDPKIPLYSTSEFKAITIGFDPLAYKGQFGDNLKKVVLTKMSRHECTKHYPPNILLLGGFDFSTHHCYSDTSKPVYECQSDKGAQLYTYNKDINCMYTVVGIITQNDLCSRRSSSLPGLYTKIRTYTSWIESQVWPN